MKISAVNSQRSFGNVYLIKSTTNSPYVKSRKIDDSTYGVALLLNNKNHRLYSKRDGEKIRNFFAANIDDYTGRNGSKMVRAGQNIFLITGKDIKNYNNFMANKNQQCKEIYSNRFLSESAKIAQIANLDCKEQEYLSIRENGEFSLSSSKFAGWVMSYEQMMGYAPCNYKLDRISFKPFDKKHKEGEIKL